jgi:hypothetical protein
MSNFLQIKIPALQIKYFREKSNAFALTLIGKDFHNKTLLKNMFLFLYRKNNLDLRLNVNY